MEDFGYDEVGMKLRSERASSARDSAELSSGGDPVRREMLKHRQAKTTTSSRESLIRASASSSGEQQLKADAVAAEKNRSSNSIPLPQRFVVKYLGVHETSNLWGIKYTREPVDTLVADAKRLLSTSTGKTLPLLKLEVDGDGITVGPMPQNTNPNFPVGKFPIEAISYGVQDLVYTRVFAMIVVRPENSGVKLSELSRGNSHGPYRCHAFVTDTKQTAKNLTFALASAFEQFSQKVSEGKVKVEKPKRFAIDLRSQEEMESDLMDSSEA